LLSGPRKCRVAAVTITPGRCSLSSTVLVRQKQLSGTLQLAPTGGQGPAGKQPSNRIRGHVARPSARTGTPYYQLQYCRLTFDEVLSLTIAGRLQPYKGATKRLHVGRRARLPVCSKGLSSGMYPETSRQRGRVAMEVQIRRKGWLNHSLALWRGPFRCAAGPASRRGPGFEGGQRISVRGRVRSPRPMNALLSSGRH